MSESTSLKLKFLEASQAQKHVTHNEALQTLDVLVQLNVLDRDISVPPSVPAEGDSYIVASIATGDWLGQENAIAAWQDGSWRFFVPETGWSAWVVDETSNVQFDGSDWVSGQSGGTTTFGINATADQVNRLAVASDAILFNHDGNGVQTKLNKNTTADTATLLYQTGSSGRAEIGLAGNDDLSFKISNDGANWLEVLRVDGTSGDVAMPQGITTNSVNQGPLAGFRNLLINGCFRIWQRATSAAHVGGYSYDAPDRWGGRRGSNVSGMSVSRQTGDKGQYALRTQRDSGNAAIEFLMVSTALETADVIPLQGRPATLSFRARAGASFSAASNQLEVKIQSGSGTDQRLDDNFTGNVAVASDLIALTINWQEFSLSGTVSGTASGLGASFKFSPTGTAGADDWFEIEQVQLETGTLATPFELRPSGIEEQMCLRYFEKWAPGSGSALAIVGVRISTFSTAALSFSPKRIAPAISETGTWDLLGVGGETNTLAFAGVTQRTCAVNVTTSGTALIAREALTLAASVSGNILQFDAELT